MKKTSKSAVLSRAVKTFVIVAVAAVVLILAARWFRTLEGVESFIDTYPGPASLPESAPTGFPAWLGWQHFFNAFFIILLLKSGWQMRNQVRPPAHWRSKKNRSGPRLSITLWLHLSLTLFWIVNGAIFIILLFITGQWTRIVPTSWDVFPNALSAALQYASLDWPIDDGWVAYNGLQLLTYFVTVFIAAPLAIFTGYRMSSAWPGSPTLNQRFTVAKARTIHNTVLVYYAAFIVVHVGLVLLTGVQRNLNHVYAARNDDSWMGLIMFGISIFVIAVGWVATQGVLLRTIASTTGKVTK